jgi:hypothetical protein
VAPRDRTALKEAQGITWHAVVLERDEFAAKKKLLVDKMTAVEAVRDLSSGLGFEPQAAEAHTGFEPVLPP